MIHVHTIVCGFPILNPSKQDILYTHMLLHNDLSTRQRCCEISRYGIVGLNMFQIIGSNSNPDNYSFPWGLSGFCCWLHVTARSVLFPVFVNGADIFPFFVRPINPLRTKQLAHLKDRRGHHDNVRATGDVISSVDLSAAPVGRNLESNSCCWFSVQRWGWWQYDTYDILVG